MRKTLTDQAFLADVCVPKHGATWIGTGETYVKFMYTVTLDNFRSVFSGLSNFEVTDLLTMDTTYRPVS